MIRVCVAFGLAIVFVAAPAGASCLGTTLPQVAQGLGAIGNDALVVTAPVETDTPLASPAKSEELAVRVATLLAGKLANAHAHGRTASLDQARAVASRAGLLVYLHPQIQKGQLRITADAYPVIHNIWDRARLPAPPPSAHAYAAAPIDAEVHAFFPTISLEQASIHKVTHTESEVLAAACGDVDGDGGSEIVLVSRERVALGRMRAGQFAVERSAAWAALAKRVPVPLREPIGGAEIDVGQILVGTTDRGGVRLDPTLAAMKSLGGIPVGGGLCATQSALGISSAPALCDESASATSNTVDAVSAFDLVSTSGDEHRTIATRNARGHLQIKVGDAERASFDAVGAQVALYDADLDGNLDVAFSAEGAEDVLTLATLKADGSRVVAKWPAPGGVRALAACPPEERGSAALVAIVGNEVWLVR